ncbi:hypothetical protein BH20BAC1_BH20BAC1_18170 [soil metagenome]
MIEKSGPVWLYRVIEQIEIGLKKRKLRNHIMVKDKIF